MKRTVRDDSGAWSLANIAPARASETAMSGVRSSVAVLRVDAEDVAGAIDDRRGERVVAERRRRNRQHRPHVVRRQDLRRRRRRCPDGVFWEMQRDRPRCERSGAADCDRDRAQSHAGILSSRSDAPCEGLPPESLPVAAAEAGAVAGLVVGAVAHARPGSRSRLSRARAGLRGPSTRGLSSRPAWMPSWRPRSKPARYAGVCCGRIVGGGLSRTPGATAGRRGCRRDDRTRPRSSATRRARCSRRR